MAESQFGAPKHGTAHDVGVFMKLAQRVESTLKDNIVFPEPKQLDPRTILVAPLNRDGAPPNVQHIHHGILKSFLQKGFDRSRPAVGICVQFTSEDGKNRLLEHNRRFSKGCSLLPPIEADKAMYGSLAASHLNLALRILQSGTPSPIGDLGSLTSAHDKSLNEVVANGHRWWVLPEETPAERQVDISVWRNADQNENHGTHEVEILQTISTTASEIARTSRKVLMGDLQAKAARRNPTKISPTILGTLAKYFVQFLNTGHQYLIQELVDFHSMNVNPRELCVSNAFFQGLVSEEVLEKAPFTRHYLLLAQYTTEKTRSGGTGAAISAFLEQTVIVQFVKKPDTVAEVEKKIREIRGEYLPILETTLSPKQARLELAVYVDLIIRCLFSKQWPSNLPKRSLAMGKFSSERVRDLGIVWAQLLDSRFPDMGFAAATGLQPSESAEGEESQEVPLGNLRDLKRNPSAASADGPTTSSATFQRGDLVTVARRMSWPVPRPNNAEFRRDITVGTEGVVEGFADSSSRQVLLKVSLDFPEGMLDVVHPAFPRNLKLTKDYNLQKAGASVKNPEADAARDEKSDKKIPDWLLGNSSPSAVKVEKNWVKVLADTNTLNKTWWLKSRIGVCVGALAETFPKFTEKDLVVVHRQNAKGVWHDELWTKRGFAAHELLLAPLTSQLKDTHLTAAANAAVGIPRHGRGSHPEQTSLALDGRTRTSIAHAGSIDASEHTGSLFWLVHRTLVASDANLNLESITWTQQIEIQAPFLKKRKFSVVDWVSADLPTIPVLVNKKAIKEHTRLVVFQAIQADKQEKGSK